MGESNFIQSARTMLATEERKVFALREIISLFDNTPSPTENSEVPTGWYKNNGSDPVLLPSWVMVKFRDGEFCKIRSDRVRWTHNPISAEEAEADIIAWNPESVILLKTPIPPSIERSVEILDDQFNEVKKNIDMEEPVSVSENIRPAPPQELASDIKPERIGAWTPAEDLLVMEVIKGNKTALEVSKLLPNRTMAAVYTRTTTVRNNMKKGN